MAVTAALHAIDVGAFEFNDELDPDAYTEIVETQNHVYRDSRPCFFSLAVSDPGGWPTQIAAAPGNPIVGAGVIVPEGMDAVRVTVRAKNVVVRLYDYTAAATVVTLSFGGTENQQTATYTLPATGARSLGLLASGAAAGYIRCATLVGAGTALP